MTVRQELERLEHRRLNPLAAFADKTKGRPRFEEDREEDVRTCYQRDIDRIVHCKAFRRLVHKTQVFLSPEGDHYRTRMTHTLEVARIASTITRALGLNEDLPKPLLWATIWAIHPLATPVKWPSATALADPSVTTSRAFVWWTCWKRMDRD